MKQFALSAVVYSLIGFVVLAFCSTSSPQSIYDKYLVRMEGVTIAISNVRTANDFYTDVLDFEAIKSTTHGVLSYLLPDGKKLFLVPKTKQNIRYVVDHFFPNNNNVLIYVRNGFGQLHETISKRSKLPNYSLSEEKGAIAGLPQHVSNIEKTKWGEYFVATDPDGNNLVFYRPFRKKSGEEFLPEIASFVSN
jgi:catechol 2,3-dioxygenase-like lactoylglutathione lyase family enzyme